MTKADWQGVIPALTTPFDPELKVDHGALAAQARRMVAAGCRGVVALGSLGEAATLEWEEKLGILRTLRKSVEAPVIAGISALSTEEAVRMAREAEKVGCDGLMVLPPYVYRGDWREMKAHMGAVMGATKLSCMLYNNPVAYGTDFVPEQIVELEREHKNLEAVKESSTDARRVTALRELDSRLAILVGVDDCVLEGKAMGAVGWIAGVTNALPEETVRLFEGGGGYYKLLPLLRMDTVPKFVQLIKLMQEVAGCGSERVRAPRLVLVGAEREAAVGVIRGVLGKGREKRK